MRPLEVPFKGKKFELIDILGESPNAPVLREFETVANAASDSKDPLASNYRNIVDTLPEYDAFTLIKYESEIVAFSGLYRGHLPPGTVRALTRTYYSPVFRSHSLAGQVVPGLATGIMLPYQIGVAKRLGKSCIFVSMQGDKRTKALGRVFEKLNAARPENSWTVLEGMYNTCRPIHGEINDCESCWQNVAVLYLKEQVSFPLPKKKNA